MAKVRGFQAVGDYLWQGESFHWLRGEQWGLSRLAVFSCGQMGPCERGCRMLRDGWVRAGTEENRMTGIEKMPSGAHYFTLYQQTWTKVPSGCAFVFFLPPFFRDNELTSFVFFRIFTFFCLICKKNKFIYLRSSVIYPQKTSWGEVMNACPRKASLDPTVELKDDTTRLNIQLFYCSPEDDLFIFTHVAPVNSSCISPI